MPEQLLYYDHHAAYMDSFMSGESINTPPELKLFLASPRVPRVAADLTGPTMTSAIAQMESLTFKQWTSRKRLRSLAKKLYKAGSL